MLTKTENGTPSPHGSRKEKEWQVLCCVNDLTKASNHFFFRDLCFNTACNVLADNILQSGIGLVVGLVEEDPITDSTGALVFGDLEDSLG